MWKRWHSQQTYYTLVLVLVAPLVASSFTLNRLFQAPQAREQQALESLRAIVARSDPPSEARLRDLESQFRRTRAAALARFLRGKLNYDAGDFAAAAEILSQPAIGKRTLLGDHALFLLASSLVELNRLSAAETRFAQLVQTYPTSILVRDASFQASELAATQGHLKRAVSHLAALAHRKDTAALLRMAQLYERLNDQKRAIAIYQEIYFDLPPSREALDAEQRLQSAGALVKGSTQVPFSRMRKRAEAVYHAHAYGDVIQFYTDFLQAYPETARDEELRLHYGISLYETRSLRQAVTVLKNLRPAAPSLQAERLYYLAESYRRRGSDAAFVTISRQLVKQYPRSRWTAATLRSRARHFRRQDRDELAVRAYKQLVKLQPHSRYAPEASYRVGLAAYFQRRYDEAARYFIHHIANYVNSKYYGPALYWAARAEERRGRPDRALVIFDRVVERYRYTAYGQMAQARIRRLRAKHKQLKPSQPPPKSLLGRALANIKRARPTADAVDDLARSHLEKARQLRVIRLNELAVRELRVALKLAPRSPAVSLELARIYRDQGDHLAAINIMRRAHPEYTLYQGGEISREEERLLFPLTHWDTIRQEAERYGLDPYFIAGLIRQESGFDETARSRAGARGLMQLIPSTGRRVARRYGLRHISVRQLYDPELNIRLGVSYLAQLVKRFGKLEYAAVAYNAGPPRQARWLRQYPHLEMDEWIERIPFRETRSYVKAVLRNAAHYRRIYGRENGSPPSS